MTPERQKILAGEILELSDKINQDVETGFEIDLEDYHNLQMMADVLARQVVAFEPPEEKKKFIDDWKARKISDSDLQVEAPDPVDLIHTATGARHVEVEAVLTRKLVRYTVDFEATVEYDPETEDDQDAVSDIDIPEGGKNDSRYLENTFNILDWEDHND